LQGLKANQLRKLRNAIFARIGVDETWDAGDFLRALGATGFYSLKTPIMAASDSYVLEQASQAARGRTAYEDESVEALGDYYNIDPSILHEIKSKDADASSEDSLSVASSKDYLSVASSEDSIASSKNSVASKDSVPLASSKDSSKDSVASSKDSLASSAKSSVSFHKAHQLLCPFTHHASLPIPHSLPTLLQAISVADSDMVTSYADLMRKQKKAMEKKGAKFSKKDLEPINSNSKTLRKAKSAREPIPGKNLSLSTKSTAIVCDFHKVPLSEESYTADRPGAVAHHFCFRERGEDIPKGCRGIASAYIIKYINKNYDAIRSESVALNKKRKREE